MVLRQRWCLGFERCPACELIVEQGQGFHGDAAAEVTTRILDNDRHVGGLEKRTIIFEHLIRRLSG